MAKTHQQLEEERRERLEERRRILIAFPGMYQRDFDGAFKKYLQRTFPVVDQEDCDVLFDPFLRKSFVEGWPEEAQELSQKYHLMPVWDPDGDQLPRPFIENPAIVRRRQNERFWPEQIEPEILPDLPPYDTHGRFLLIEVDLSKPWREIKASLTAIIAAEKKHLQVSGAYHEYVDIPEPKNTADKHNYEKMKVWEMVEQEGRTSEDDEKKILWRLAKVKTSETTDSSDGKNWFNEERRLYAMPLT
jgi:hypothetical protein